MNTPRHVRRISDDASLRLGNGGAPMLANNVCSHAGNCTALLGNRALAKGESAHDHGR